MSSKSSRGIQRYDVTQTYSDIVVHGSIVYLSGQVPWTTESGTIQEQAAEVFQRIDTQLARVNSDRTKLLSLQIFLKDPKDYKAMNSEFTKWIPEGAAPARNTICGVKFPNKAWRIEVVVTAAI